MQQFLPIAVSLVRPVVLAVVAILLIEVLLPLALAAQIRAAS